MFRVNKLLTIIRGLTLLQYKTLSRNFRIGRADDRVPKKIFFDLYTTRHFVVWFSRYSVPTNEVYRRMTQTPRMRSKNALVSGAASDAVMRKFDKLSSERDKHNTIEHVLYFVHLVRIETHVKVTINYMIIQREQESECRKSNTFRYQQ